MENETPERNQKTRSNAALIFFWVAGAALAAFAMWRLYLAFEFVKLIFQIIFLPIRMIGELFNHSGR